VIEEYLKAPARFSDADQRWWSVRLAPEGASELIKLEFSLSFSRVSKQFLDQRC